MRSQVSVAIGDTFRSLRQRNFRLWFVGQSISMTGYFGQVLALAILVLELTDSGVVLGVTLALNFVPNLVIGPWAGVLSDRVNKRWLLLATQTTMMICAVVLGVVVLAEWVTVGWVVALAAVSGFAFAVDQPARRTIVTELVGDADAANAISLNGALNQGAKLVGPAAAGVLIDTVGIGWCFLVNGASSLAVIAALMAIDSRSMRRVPRLPRAPGQIREGFRYVWADRSARRLLAMLGVVTFIGFNWNVLLPLFVKRDLHGTPGTVALLFTVMSAGSLGGILWCARRTQIGAATLAHGCTGLGLFSVLMAWAPSVVVAALAAVAIGAASIVLFNGGIVVLQLGAVPEMRGRMMAMFSMVALGAYGLGGPVSGWMAERWGVRTSIAIGAVVTLAVGLAATTALRTSNRTHATAAEAVEERWALDG